MPAWARELSLEIREGVDHGPSFERAVPTADRDGLDHSRFTEPGDRLVGSFEATFDQLGGALDGDDRSAGQCCNQQVHGGVLPDRAVPKVCRSRVPPECQSWFQPSGGMSAGDFPTARPALLQSIEKCLAMKHQHPLAFIKHDLVVRPGIGLHTGS